jgi:hypothetical protein
MEKCECNEVKKITWRKMLQRCAVLVKKVIDKSTHASDAKGMCCACGSRLIVQRSVRGHEKKRSSKDKIIPGNQCLGDRGLCG